MRSPRHGTTSRLGGLKNTTHATTIYYPVDQAGINNASSTNLPSPRADSSGEPGFVGRIFRHWWLEILAGVLVVLSFSGLVAVLHAYQDKPLPNWPLNLSINTALSVFGAVFRAPVLFIAAEGIGQLKWQWLSRKRPLHDLSSYDSATRGPWGASKLLWKARWRDGFAFLGATIIVVSFGIDPFTQAVVSYYDCSVPVDRGVSSISHINSLLGVRLGDSLPTWARTAIDQSLGDSTSIMPDFTCSTPRCNFSETYHSIGLCSKCIDVTNEIITSCVPGTEPGAGCSYNLSRPNIYRTPFNTTAGYSYGLTAHKRAFISSNSSNSSISKLPTIRDWDLFSVERYGAKEGIDRITSPLGENGTRPSYQTSTFDIVSAKPILGYRCFLYYCMRSYTATIEGHVLRENLESTSSNWSNYTKDTPVLGTVRVNCLSTEAQNQLLSDGRISRDTEWMPWTGIGPADPLIPADCAYQLQPLYANAVFDTNEDFSVRLHGTLQGKGTLTDDTIRLESTEITQFAGLWDNGTLTLDSISSAFQNFSTAVTNYLRRVNSPIPANITYLQPEYVRNPIVPNPIVAAPETRNQVVEGQALTDTKCIHVRWPWLALPAAIFFGTLVFLVALIVKTALDHETEVWKSSPNALLWHGLAGETEEESVVLSSKAQMEKRAREIQVQLGMTRRGWKLVQQ